MQKQEKLNKIRQRYATLTQNTATAPQPAEQKKDGIIATLTSLLKKNKETKDKTTIVATPEQPPATSVQPPVAPVLTKLPSSSNPSPKATARREAMLKRQQERTTRKADALYQEAIRKGEVKDGTVDSLILKEAITNNYEQAYEAISKAPDPVMTRKQNAEQSSQDLKRRMLMKKVDYVNPSEDRNVAVGVS